MLTSQVTMQISHQTASSLVSYKSLLQATRKQDRLVQMALCQALDKSLHLKELLLGYC